MEDLTKSICRVKGKKNEAERQRLGHCFSNLRHPESPRPLVKNRLLQLVGLGWDSITCISTKFPCDADSADHTLRTITTGEGYIFQN